MAAKRLTPSTRLLHVSDSAKAQATRGYLTQRGISIVLPAWNEEAVIADVVESVVFAARRMTPDFEVIVVDDGSTDRTGEVVDDLAEEYPQVRPIHNWPNQGYGGAVVTGFQEAKKELLFFMDSDGQFDIHDLALLIEPLERGEGDIVLGYRAHRQDSPLRLLNAWAWKQLVCTLFQFRVKDIDCAFKLMPTRLVRAVSVESRSAMLNAEMLAKFARMDLSATEVPIQHFPRQKGKATGANLRVIARAFRELYHLAGHIKQWTPPPDVPPLQLVGASREADSCEVQRAAVSQRLTASSKRIGVAASAPDMQRGEAGASVPTASEQSASESTALHAQESAARTITAGQTVTLLTLALVWIASLWIFGMPVLVGTIAAVTIVYVGDLLLTLLLALHTIHFPPESQIDEALIRSLSDYEWPRYTILCPLYRETEVVAQYVTAMRALDYPHEKLQILFLTEENDPATRDAIAAMHLPSYFEIVTVPNGQPRTKPRACNYGLELATGDYVVIYDAEDIPDPLQLKKAVLTFAQAADDVACVQARLNFYNPMQNLLTRWFTAEYSLWFDLTLPGLQWARWALPLGGTSNHFRTAVLRRVGAWDSYNVTEDCDLGLRLAHFHLRTVMLDSTTMEEANAGLKNWVRQRSRWIKGYLQSYLVHMRRPQRYVREGRLRDLFSLQVVVGARSLMLFVNPIMWALLAIYIGFRPIVTPIFHILYPAPVFYAGLGCLVFGNFIYVYTYLIACARRQQFDLMIFVLGVPLYWAMMSVAASIALVQLVYAPHYWEKTRHGLHLQNPAQSFQGAAIIQHVAGSLGGTARVGAQALHAIDISMMDTQEVPTTASMPE
jgi:cellulose synthase/poly-beta-1,6-N-acetylglucosamine synthase-like glycosyltransferase